MSCHYSDIMNRRRTLNPQEVFGCALTRVASMIVWQWPAFAKYEAAGYTLLHCENG